MKLKPFARPFWADSTAWPMDGPGMVYLARAVCELGPIISQEWVGDEGAAFVIPQPAMSDRRSVLAILSRDDDYRPDMAGENEAANYARAMDVRDRLNADAAPKAARFHDVASRLHRALLEGEVRSFFRGSGSTEEIPMTGWWDDAWEQAFTTCQWTVHGGPAPVRYPIYLDRSSFQSFLIQSRPATAPATAGRRTKARNILEQVMRDSPDVKSMTNDQLRERLATEGVPLSAAAFEDEKRAAIAATGATAWSAAGRPRKSENRPAKSR